MKDEVVAASKFKAHCLALLEKVRRTGQTIVVTKRGTPVARVVPLEPDERRSIVGSVTFLTDKDEDLFSTGERWNADSE